MAALETFNPAYTQGITVAPGAGLVVVDDTPGAGKIATLSSHANFLASTNTLFVAMYTI